VNRQTKQVCTKRIQGSDPADVVTGFIPLDKAGYCVNCDRIFTLQGLSTCPKCGSKAWRTLKAWLDGFYPRREVA
jgi:hypothetical protein